MLLEQHDPRLTAEAQNLERQARWRRYGGDWRDGSETEASWRRDADGGETADADEVEARWQMEARDGGEMQMEARWRRDGGEMEAAAAATRVAATSGESGEAGYSP